MKFASYYYNDKLDVEPDEYNITYNEEYNDYEVFLQRLQEWSDKRVNVCWIGEFDPVTIKGLMKYNENIHMRILQYQLPQVQELKELEVPFFFDVSIGIFSYGLLGWCFDVGPTDIYITDDLMHNLENVSKQCKAHNIAIRAVLNRVPSASGISASRMDSIVFRPEDYFFLNSYIDTAEFDISGDDKSFYDERGLKLNLLEVLYRRWFIEHKWPEDMKYLNRDITYDFPTQYMTPRVNEYKYTCKTRCLSSPNSICNKCNMEVEFGQIFQGIFEESI